jgi:hypothetical protein
MIRVYGRRFVTAQGSRYDIHYLFIRIARRSGHYIGEKEERETGDYTLLIRLHDITACYILLLLRTLLLNWDQYHVTLNVFPMMINELDI